MVRYCELLEEENKKFNLTAVREPEGIMHTLLLGSLTLIPALPDTLRGYKPAGVVDIGAGAGIPGIPLAIVYPNWRVTMMESIGKKARFMAGAAGSLELTNVTILAERAEVAGLASLRDAADLAVARAVASLPTLVELAAPLVRAGGWMAFPKSGDVRAELAEATVAMRTLNVALAGVVPVPRDLGLPADHVTVLLQKTGHTPIGYPRRPGLAKQRPLGGTP
ncbi:MAG: 16S rRNA (guanine(527)-N(7))-methyltransferase RsmG [Chloroflexota bacterium]